MTHLKFIMNIVVGASLMASSAVHAYGEHSDPDLKRLIQVFAEAEKDPGKLDAAFSVAEQTVKANPNNPIALVYKGSLATQRARDAWMPWNKLSFLKDGIDLMDQALDIASRPPINPDVILEVRMVRALTSARIPAVFGRGSVARGDLTYILTQPGFKSMKVQDQASVYAWLAVYAHRDNQANEAANQLKTAIALDKITADAIWAGK
jgi:tetratricopeptide (TPR) repeat protein